jgi:formate dehydrogenase maturation protein FdhE
VFSEEKDSTVLARIKRGECPICGGELKSNAVVVNDARYGKVKVCNTHKVAVAGVKDE